MSMNGIGVAFNATGISPTAKLLLVYLGDGDRGGVTDLNLPAAAAFLGVTQDVADQALAVLVEEGFVQFLSSHEVRVVGCEPASVESKPTKRQLPAKLRLQIIERDGYACKKCGSKENLEVDHIHPESKGGNHDPSNLQCLCRPCNLRKGTRLEVVAS